MIPHVMVLMYLQIYWSLWSTKICFRNNHLILTTARHRHSPLAHANMIMNSTWTVLRDIANDVNILGVTLDSKLNFKIHISEPLRKAYAMAAGL